MTRRKIKVKRHHKKKKIKWRNPPMKTKVIRLLEKNLDSSQVEKILRMLLQSEAGTATRKTIKLLLKQEKFLKYHKVFIKILEENKSS